MTTRRAGSAELAVRRDLRRYTPAARRTALATAALTIARSIDAPAPCASCEHACGHPAADPRELATLSRELRACLTDLAKAFPPAADRDGIDELADRRAGRRSVATTAGQ